MGSTTVKEGSGQVRPGHAPQIGGAAAGYSEEVPEGDEHIAARAVCVCVSRALFAAVEPRNALLLCERPDARDWNAAYCHGLCQQSRCTVVTSMICEPGCEYSKSREAAVY
jgi:hypothetical protein